LVLPDAQPSSHVYGRTDPDLFFGTCGIPVDTPQDRGEQGERMELPP
jgi:hypothetical protein